MWQPSPPPAAPVEATELLSELAAYYQELVEYHQKAAHSAYVCLTHLEALLGEREVMSVQSLRQSDEKQEQSLQLPSSQTEQLIRSEEMGNAANQINGEPESEKTVEKSDEESDERETIKNLLKLNQGKILHIDYIARELSQSNEASNHKKIKSILTQGEKESLWAKVPDSPGCWTWDLKDLPDLAIKAKSQKKRTGKKLKNIPRSGKMKKYPTLTNAVADCLQQNYPQVCTTQTIAEWLYPRGLNSVSSKQVKESIGKVLSRGEGDFWTRVAIGKYVWKGRK